MKKDLKGLKEAEKERRELLKNAAPQPEPETTTTKRKRKANKSVDYEYETDK